MKIVEDAGKLTFCVDQDIYVDSFIPGKLAVSFLNFQFMVRNNVKFDLTTVTCALITRKKDRISLTLHLMFCQHFCTLKITDLVLL